jgi:hypothetical protein
MDQTLEKYLDCIMSYAKRNEADAVKVRSELEDHLLKKVDDLKEQGLSQSEAVFKAIEDHGQPWTIGYKLQKKRFSARTLAGIVCLLIVILSVMVIMPATAKLKFLLCPSGDNVVVIAGPQAKANLQVAPGRALTVLSSDGTAGIHVVAEEALLLLLALPTFILLCMSLLAVILIFKRTKKIKPVLT